jgi:uncharacterized tellurite resistance protein B-like protein
MRKSLKRVLMERDGVTSAEADELIEAARDECYELIEAGAMTEAMDICEAHFGLEPDYLDDLGII